MVQVPLIGSIACGTPITAEQNIECYIGVPAAWHADFAPDLPRRQHGTHNMQRGHRLHPLPARGGAGRDRRRAGGRGSHLKHFHRQGDAVMLLADNAAVCPPMFYAGEQLSELHIEGKAVGLCRGL